MPSRRGQGQPNWLMGVVFNWVKDLALLGLFQKLVVFLISEQQIWMLRYENVLDRIIHQVSLRYFEFSLQ
jgi:hypothetical protein